MSRQITLRVTQDSFTDEGHPNRNYADSTRLRVEGGGSPQRAYLGFSLKVIPRDAVVFSATLKLTLRDTGWSGGPHTITAKRINQRWSEGRITWNNAPGVVDLNEATEAVSGGTAGDVIEIDVTDMVNDAVVGDRRWHGIRLTVDTSGQKAFFSSDAAVWTRRPKLIVEYGTTPDAPSQLNPRGGNAVSATKPRLSWTITGGQSQSRVQVHTADDFTTPDYDSGWVANVETQWDLLAATSPAFGAIADDDERYWRVKIKDENGTESAWSNSQRFERRSYGLLAIVSPNIDGAAVLESTPTIVTEFSGRTQTRIGWQVAKLVSGATQFEVTSTVDFDAGRATDDPSFELERGAIDDPSASYVVIVRVWDEFDRGTAVGETSYVQEQRFFVYSPTDSVLGVTNLTAEQYVSGAPIINLSWERAAAPDSFDIYMNDFIIAQNVDPADVFLSGTTYGYVVWQSLPNQSQTFRVVPKENSEDSDDLTEVTISPKTIGIWLIVPQEDLFVALYGDDEAPMVLGEEATTFYPQNRRTPVRLQDSIRGLEGTISGMFLQALDGPSAAEWRTRIMRLKELAPHTEMRLALSRSNVPVVVGAVNISPDPNAEEFYHVSVDFWQIGEFEVHTSGEFEETN